MQRALCLDFGLQKIESYLTDVKIGHRAYSYILDMDYGVYLHPLLNKLVTTDALPTITEVEFPEGDET